MTYNDYIATAGVLATGLAALVTWFAMKRKFASKKLSYSYSIESLLRSSEPDLTRDLKVFYQGEELPSPTLLSLEIMNVGLTAIEDAKVVIQIPGTTYLIPGYFVDIPAGYSMLWYIDRTDAEECTIHFKHINPRQVARVRLLMDELPSGEPSVSCPMANVECTKTSLANLSVFAKFLLQQLAPQLLPLLRIR